MFDIFLLVLNITSLIINAERGASVWAAVNGVIVGGMVITMLWKLRDGEYR